ncbi:MAG: chlorophyll synthesis pathway protein BchC, partial [Pseudomonadota bacterium]
MIAAAQTHETTAVVFEQPEALSVRALALKPMGDNEVCIAVAASGVSTGTERLLWSGRMPPFPGLGYPLVPGYESVGEIVDAGPGARSRIGERSFVPGAACFEDARGLFGATASTLIAPSDRVISLPDTLAEEGALRALASTARHAIAGGDPPDLIVGHGVLGRLLARLSLAEGFEAPTVWETNPARRNGADGYQVVDPADDDRRDYRAIYDVSGDSGLLNTLIGALARGGEVVLAGFYEKDLSFAFPPAFMKEARIRVAAEWRPDDMTA